MTTEQLTTEIDDLKKELAKLKETTDEDKKKDFWLKFFSSIFLPLAITASGYWFSQAIKKQDMEQSRDHDAVANQQYQQQMQLSIQNQRLETYKFVTPLLDIMVNNPDPQKRVYAAKVITEVLPNDAPELLKTAITSDPANTKKYQTALDSTQGKLVAGLFSENASTRTNSANDIMVNWYKTASIVPQLVDYALQNMNNANGIFNTVVVLQNMHGSVLKVNKAKIQDFLQKVMKLDNMHNTVTNAKDLYKALNTL
ncbi:hypothetical protein [Mucilaginibacter rubeus]|uniref:Uncharacterized protein n=1 Tax=Mucilaginibacter rubeus TaxID=2027860 RepID=A0A5C1HVG2_9SPHI|nr:hypothetical protein [Mucilaginibacter rubeus]QEM08738.1 hypothetical protein DEO27_001465 [Mucilaginibacter rubeus]